MCCVRPNTWLVQLFLAPHFGNLHLFNTLIIHTSATFGLGVLVFYLLWSNIVDSCSFPFFKIFMPVFSSLIMKWTTKRLVLCFLILTFQFLSLGAVGPLHLRSPCIYIGSLHFSLLNFQIRHHALLLFDLVSTLPLYFYSFFISSIISCNSIIYPTFKILAKNVPSLLFISYSCNLDCRDWDESCSTSFCLFECFFVIWTIRFPS